MSPCDAQVPPFEAQVPHFEEKVPHCEAQVPPCEAKNAFLWGLKKQFVKNLNLHTFLTENFNLRTCEAGKYSIS